MAQYDISGNLLKTITPTAGNEILGTGPWGFDLAPDNCTIYYGGWNDLNGIDRFNACTDTQEAVFAPGENLIDDLRVLPNWDVITLTDSGGAHLDDSGKYAGPGYASPFLPGNEMRNMSLDPDGTSLWETNIAGGGVARYNIATGQLLSTWGRVDPGLPLPQLVAGGPISVYGPPLFGTADVAQTVDSNPTGTARAFLTHVRYSGSLNRLHLWVDFSSTARNVVVGVYANRNDHPADLQEQATITNVRPGSWNYVDLPSMTVTSGERYWVAALGVDGTVSLRDGASGGQSETCARRNLTGLPEHWTGAAHAGGAGPLSAFGS